MCVWLDWVRHAHHCMPYITPKKRRERRHERHAHYPGRRERLLACLPPSLMTKTQHLEQQPAAALHTCLSIPLLVRSVLCASCSLIPLPGFSSISSSLHFSVSSFSWSRNILDSFCLGMRNATSPPHLAGALSFFLLFPFPLCAPRARRCSFVTA